MAACATSTDNDKSFMECSLCLSIFQQPKCLLCQHTFCLNCLQKYVNQNKLRDKFPCPLCRQMFTIPSQGLDSIPDNLFIQNMIEIERNSEALSGKLNIKVQCDLCLDDDNKQNKPAASKYCVDCNQNLCKSCVTYHGRMNGTKSHALASLSEKLEHPARVGKICSRFCKRHSNEPLRLYCLKCDVCVCVSCLATEHNEHRCQSLDDAFTKYQGLFDTSLSKLQELLTFGHNSVQNLQAADVEMVMEFSKNEQKIRERCDKLRRILDGFEEELLCEARKFRVQKVKENKSQLDEIEFQKVQLEGFIRYLSEVKEHGSSYDVASSGKELITRAEHLLKSSKEVFSREFKRIPMTFIPCNESRGVEFGSRLLGKLVIEADKSIMSHDEPASNRRLLQYDRNFLLQLRMEPVCLVKPKNLPDYLGIVLNDLTFTTQPRAAVDFTPGYPPLPQPDLPDGRYSSSPVSEVPPHVPHSSFETFPPSLLNPHMDLHSGISQKIRRCAPPGLSYTSTAQCIDPTPGRHQHRRANYCRDDDLERKKNYKQWA